ncbi:MAG: glutamyl-tRNA reductase [Chlamydiae bacterium]|nr:glutamyl-tRNA reductase [Chlamydiota bacterium]MBI3277399.1 glutamyl-tRNA reductase [Chlamydiota bacterium]
MNIQVIGLNHKTADVALREKLAFSQPQAMECLKRIRELGLASEALVLSTCNRVEFYKVWDRSDSLESLAKFLGQFHKVSIPDFEKSLYFYEGRDAVRHLFRVASGLDSMVVGETEVLGQVKKAYQLASEIQSTGLILNTLFQKSFYVAKLLQSTTKIHEGSLSVSSVAVQLAEKIFGSLFSKTVLLVGAGKVSEQTVRKLVEKGVKGIIASNRSFEKAQSLAQKFSGKAIRFDEIKTQGIEADILISSTAAPHFILHREDVLELMDRRRQHSLFMIDIAVPRDIDPEVNALDNVYLYNIDDLKGIAEKNLQERLKECEKADALVEEETGRFMNRYQVMITRSNGISGKN